MSETAPSAAVIDAWATLLHAERILRDKVEEDLKGAGLPPMDWYHLLHEADTSPRGFVRQAAAQKSMQLAQYNMCRLVDRLEREGLVERHTCPVDGRNNVVVITDKGRTLRRSMWPIYAQAVQSHFGARLSDAEATQLIRLLAKLNPPRSDKGPEQGPAGPSQPLV